MDNHFLFLEKKFKEVSRLIPKNSRILDVGCNDGKLRGYLDSCNYFGVDIDKEAINQLTKKNIKARQIDLDKDKLPFNDNSFDFVTLLDVIEHVSDPHSLIVQSKTKLRKNGKLIITLPNDYHFLNKIRFLFNKPITQDPFAPHGHLHIFPIKNGEKFLISHGLKIIKKIPIPPVKPSFLPGYIKNFLGKKFSNSFARDILYVLEPR